MEIIDIDMDTNPTGSYSTDWKPTKLENPNFKCRRCQSDDVWYRNWESDCGGYEDTKYECRKIGRASCRERV